MEGPFEDLPVPAPADGRDEGFEGLDGATGCVGFGRLFGLDLDMMRSKRGVPEPVDSSFTQG